jgi:hypothetical protein
MGGKRNAVFWDVTPCGDVLEERIASIIRLKRIPEDDILHSRRRETSNLT